MRLLELNNPNISFEMCHRFNWWKLSSAVITWSTTVDIRFSRFKKNEKVLFSGGTNTKLPKIILTQCE